LPVIAEINLNKDLAYEPVEALQTPGFYPAIAEVGF